MSHNSFIYVCIFAIREKTLFTVPMHQVEFKHKEYTLPIEKLFEKSVMKNRGYKLARKVAPYHLQIEVKIIEFWTIKM